MKTIRMYLKRTNNIMKIDNVWSLNDRESDDCWISEIADFVLPDEITISENNVDDLSFYLTDGNPSDYGVIVTRPNGEPAVHFLWKKFNLDRAYDPNFEEIPLSPERSTI